MQGVYRSALRHAANLAGEEVLALRLRVSSFTLASWLSGSIAIPSGVFLAVADYLSEVEPPGGAQPPASEK